MRKGLLTSGALLLVLMGCVAGVFSWKSSQQIVVEAKREFGHTVFIYEGYAGQREEQKANMLDLTIARLLRIEKLYENSWVKDANLENDLADFRASLYVVRHMTRARDASRVNKEDDVVKELTQACRYADQTTYLDPRLQETCKRFRKYGYVRMT